jgi:cell division protein ZipA
MAAELRWILLALSLVLLAGIWWWGSRRSSQAPGNASLREITPSEPIRPAPAGESLPVFEIEATPDPQERDWGVSPFEPLSIRTQEYDRVPVLDGPMMVDADPAPTMARSSMPAAATAAVAAPIAVAAAPLHAAPAPVPAAGASPVVAATPSAATPSAALAANAPVASAAAQGLAQTANTSEQQKIVTLRVCAAGEARWSGATLLSALESHGLAYGRYRVFHRRHVDGRSLFCVASMVEPGTFDVARMSSEEFRGITLFAVLPGPVEPLLTIDELLGAARGLAQELAGMVQDSKGMPLSPQRAAALRDDVARFQASLHQA